MAVMILLVFALVTASVGSVPIDGQQNLDSIIEHLISLVSAKTARNQDSQPEEQCNGLNIIAASVEKVQIEFCDPVTGTGIRVVSEVSAQGTGQYSITTLEGESIVAAEKYHQNKATIMSFAGEHFLISDMARSERSAREDLLRLFGKLEDNQAAREQYIQQESIRAVKEALQRGEEMKLEIDAKVSIQERRDHSFAKLLSYPEVQLIEEAAKLLGKSGVQGTNNPSARVFYAHAMRLAKAQRTIFMDEESSKMSNAHSVFLQALSAAKNAGVNNKGQKVYTETLEQCTNYDTKCAKGECPIGDECEGMCGIGCSYCWDYWFVCGDCCYHKGCHDHDICCGDNGYFSIACLKVPFSFRCNSYKC